MLKEMQDIWGSKPFGVQLREGVGVPYSILHVESKGEIKRIPIFSIRNSGHRALIAEKIVSGEVGAFGVGVIGVLKAVLSDPSKDPHGGKKFWEIKKGRDASDKVPMMMLPEHHNKIVDYDKVHQDFSYLKDPEARRRFFGTIPFHTILPLADNAIINKDVFVTTAEESKKKPLDQQVSESTVCIFFSGGDKAWEEVAQLAYNIDSNVHLGISSLNDHGEQSPYDLDELIKYVNRKQRADFDFIVDDPIVAKYNIRSSMTIIRLPHRGEIPEITIVRKGSVGIDTLRKHMQELVKDGHPVHPIRELASAKLAGHGHPEKIRELGLDDRVIQYLQEIRLIR